MLHYLHTDLVIDRNIDASTYCRSRLLWEEALVFRRWLDVFRARLTSQSVSVVAWRLLTFYTHTTARRTEIMLLGQLIGIWVEDTKWGKNLVDITWYREVKIRLPLNMRKPNVWPISAHLVDVMWLSVSIVTPWLNRGDSLYAASYCSSNPNAVNTRYRGGQLTMRTFHNWWLLHSRATLASALVDINLLADWVSQGSMRIDVS